MVEGQQFPTYTITPLDLNDVQLRSGRILEKEKTSIVIQEQDTSEEDSLKVNKVLREHPSKTKILKNKNKKNQ